MSERSHNDVTAREGISRIVSRIVRDCVVFVKDIGTLRDYQEREREGGACK